MPDGLLSFGCEYNTTESVKEMLFVDACYDLLVKLSLEGGSRQSSSA